MRLKNEVEYVFRILLYLSKYGKDRVISSTEISEKEQDDGSYLQIGRAHV